MHPELDRLTAWVHGFLDDPEAAEVGAHVADCPDCLEAADQVRDEARLLEQALAPSPRLTTLKQELLDAAEGKRRSRGLLWQVPLAAAVLLGLVGVLFSSRSPHRLLDGRLALDDGRVLEAPRELPAAQSWQLRALEQAIVELADHSTITLRPEARLSLDPGGARGVEPRLLSGEAEVRVDPAASPLLVESPTGRVEMTTGSFTMKIVFQEEGEAPMKNRLAGALVTVIAGSAILSSPNGSVDAATGRSAVLAGTQVPMLLTTPQDGQKQEDLLRRLEQLAARVAKLEDEVVTLELKNKTLKLQLAANAPGAGAGPGGAVWSVAPGQTGNGVRVIQGAPGGGPGGVIIELKESEEKTPERKNPAPKEK